MPEDGDATLERLDAIAAALAEVGASVERQQEDLRLALEVLVELAQVVDRPPATAIAPAGNGIEVGALMGATQAAWLRLEQRIESEFGDIHRELRSLSVLTDPPTVAAIESAPGARGEQLRRAASSLRASMRGLRRTRP